MCRPLPQAQRTDGVREPDRRVPFARVLGRVTEVDLRLTLPTGQPLPRNRLERLHRLREPRCSMSRARCREPCTIWTAVVPDPVRTVLVLPK